MFGPEEERWWTDERIELLMQLRHEHRQPWPLIVKLLGARSEIAAMRKYYLVLQQDDRRLDHHRAKRENLIRLLCERQRMLKPNQPMQFADPGFKLLKKIAGMMQL